MSYLVYEQIQRTTGEIVMEVVGSIEHATSAEHALRLAKEAGFLAPVIGVAR